MKHTATASLTEFLRNEPDDDDAVAVSDHGDTPDRNDDPRQTGQQRLNNKLGGSRPSGHQPRTLRA
jgi:hypothetical protein